MIVAMKRRSLHSKALGLAATLLLVVGRGAIAQDIGIEVGKPAPVVTVQSLDGKDVSLSQFIGKTPVVMEFWATWCPNCKELEPTLKTAANKYAGKVTFIGMAVSVNESPERVQAFVKQHALPGEHFFDTHGKASDAYDVPATSFMVVIDKAGKVVYTGLGGRQDLDAAIKKAL
jgi:thiol-disulfide isomerase/thioredoxin